MKTIFLRLSLLVAGLALCATLRAEPVLLGHTSLSGQSLDSDGIKAVLLGKRITVADARVVIVIVKTSDAQEAFLKDHVSMTTSQFQNYWRRLFMTGGGTAPKIVESEDEACKLVAATPGAVAIVDSAKASGLIVLAK